MVAVSLTGRDYAKAVLFGLATMIVSLIATVVILVTVLVITRREIPVGPLYLLISISTFAAGCYWSLRRASLPKPPPKPPSTVAVVAKSAAAGLTAVLLSLIAYMTASWFVFARKTHVSIGIDIHRAVYWLAMLAIFLAAFLLEYRRASRHPSR
jgi:hypothetical protein